MIKSMTGFGKSSADMGSKIVTIEIKSLNSKQLDLNVKLPPVFREKEPEMRNIISRSLERGKIEITGSLEYTNGEVPAIINHSLVKSYYRELKEVMQDIRFGNGTNFHLKCLPDMKIMLEQMHQ